MKAKFKNIGPIKEADLELGNLTIIAGQNNTGKTYLVYTLYGFLEFFKGPDVPLYALERRTYNEMANYELIKKTSRQLKDRGMFSADIEECKKIDKQLAKRASFFFSSEILEEVFSSPNGEFEDAYFGLETEYKNGDIVESALFLPRPERRFALGYELENNAVIFRLQNMDDIRAPSPSLTSIKRGVFSLFWRMCIQKWASPFILSAERFGISLFYKELDFTKNRLVEELQKLSDKKEFDPFRFIDRQSARYAQPIKDNIDFTRDLSNIQKKKSNIQKDSIRSVKKIMDGYYRVKNDEIRFISNRRGENRFDIPLHLASSSARGVSDLYFYLKHVAQPGQILIVDEPESHLSPTNQVMMARLLAFCVNAGLKVLVTTHSDYFVKEINNLIMLNSDFKGKKEFLKRNKKDYSANDHLSPESVKAYVCENGTLSPCVVDTEGIDMPVFDEAIDKINKISMELSLLAAPSYPKDD